MEEVPPMHRIFAHVRALLVAVVLLAVAGPSPVYAAIIGDYSDLVATLLPSVVNISTIRTDTIGKDAGPSASLSRRKSLGSGFVIDPNGVIATNRHVIEGALEITVTLHDGRILGASLIAVASGADLALLRVYPDQPLPAVKWGNSDKLRQGTPVIAIGNPLGYGSSVTAGIVSALERDIKSSLYDDYIQTDASINQGNSGGPLFNLAGEVIGVNTAILTATGSSGSIGIGFSLPANDAQFVIDRLRQFGRIRPGWIGLTTQSVTPSIAEAVRLAKQGGVIVTSIRDDKPGLKGSFQISDVILSVDGNDIKDVRGFNRAIGGTPVGDVVPIVIWRDGGRMALKVMVEENADDVEQGAKLAALVAAASASSDAYVEPPDMGLNLSSITAELRGRFSLPNDQRGVVVLSVDQNSKAGEQGLLPGDVIERVGKQSVSTVREFWLRIDEARRDRTTKLLLLVHGTGGERWVALPSA
jgi:serine protease Do